MTAQELRERQSYSTIKAELNRIYNLLTEAADEDSECTHIVLNYQISQEIKIELQMSGFIIEYNDSSDATLIKSTTISWKE